MVWRAVGDAGVVLLLGVLVARWSGTGGEVVELVARLVGAGREVGARRRVGEGV